MKLGDIIDQIRALEEAEEAVNAAKTGLTFGGNPQTMRDKLYQLHLAEEAVKELRNTALWGRGEDVK